MAALYILGVDNARIEVTNSETPIMDGSAKVFYEQLKNVPFKELPAKRKYLKVLREVEFDDDKGAICCKLHRDCLANSFSRACDERILTG